jgi:hypothetical protein
MRISIAAAALLLVAGLPGPAVSTDRAQAAGPSHDEPYPVELTIGETFHVCRSGEIICPAVVPICDDPETAVPVDTPDGLGFRGVAPGTTLCSAAASAGAGLRRVFRITVR